MLEQKLEQVLEQELKQELEQVLEQELLEQRCWFMADRCAYIVENNLPLQVNLVEMSTLQVGPFCKAKVES